MRTRYDIEVTQEDIDKAVRCSFSHCIVAEALRRQIDGIDIISIDRRTIRFSLPLEARRIFYVTPPAVDDYIVAFDAGDTIQPFRFRLWKPWYDIPMRPRVESGNPKRVKDKTTRGTRRVELAMQTEGGGHTGKVMVEKDIPLPRNFRSRKGTVQRVFGKRTLRVNQQDTPSLSAD